MIPLSVPHIDGNEWKYVKECLDTAWVSSVGEYVEKFEDHIRNLTGTKNSIACVNGTAALHIALKIVGVKSNEEVLVPTLTFIAPVNSIQYVDAVPVFMDSDEYYTLDVEKVLDFIKTQTVYKNNHTYNKKTDRRITAIIPVHVFGNAVNLDELTNTCREGNIKVIEDAAESIGTHYTSGIHIGKYTGAIGDVGCYSFNGNKIITTGGGGMIITQEDEYAEKAKYLTTQAKDDNLYYIHNEIGYNYRLTNIQAALGVAQLERLQSYIKIKKRNYELYKSRLNDIPGLKVADVPDYANCNYWFYCLQIDERIYGKNRDGLLNHFRTNNIQARPIWHLNHHQKPFSKFQSYKIEKAYDLLRSTLNIPCSVNITTNEIEKVIEVVERGRK